MSTSSSDSSVASTKINATNVNGDLKGTKVSQEHQRSRRKAVGHVAYSATVQDVLLFLVAFRILNALTISTFFQPDEYFQSLEPAWRMVFGDDCGAWITWEWEHALRSAIHPAIFAAVYYSANLIADLLRLTPAFRAELFLAGPKTLQAVFAALGDYCTWRLARRIFGQESYQAWATLALTVLSPWQWFCSTRTLSNCLETTLTIAALYDWPWHWSLTDRGNARYDSAGLRMRDDVENEGVDETTRLRRSLLLAALATVLRPTNLLIWIFFAATTCLKMSRRGWFVKVPWTDRRILIEVKAPSFLRATTRERTRLIIESVLCGSAILILSVLVDRFYYQFWAFPPLKFVFFNVVQSLSIFYGRNDWHYYLSQGLPLLLTTALPFAVAGLYKHLFSTRSTNSQLTDTILSQLATVSCAVPAALSLISHKEVRFIYPLFPLLHILAAEPLTNFFAPSIVYPLRSRRTPPYALLKRLLLVSLILLNASIGIYTTTIHGRGVIDILSYLRHQHETYYMPPHHNSSNLTAAFLMPCHSTPWRSHLIHPGISAWALSCEPPLNLSSAEKTTYVDEADAFYLDPLLWLRQDMSRQPPQRASWGGIFSARDRGTRYLDSHRRQKLDNHGRREWPDYLVFFAQAEKTMEVALRGSGYAECWRGFNSHWHDDWRRKGDVVAWCLFPERSARGEDKRGGMERRRGSFPFEAVERMVDWAVMKGKKIFGSGNTAEQQVSGGLPAISASRGHDRNIPGGAKDAWRVGKSSSKRNEPSRRWWEILLPFPWPGKSSKPKKKQNVWS